jgi:NAD(P)-dependent dehydrogenase (short-subunit alcohol dehydrogenase family)
MPGTTIRGIYMSGRLFDKVAIVTGAGTGIGEAIALKFAKEGARLLLVGLPDDPVEDVARLINGAGGLRRFTSVISPRNVMRRRPSRLAPALMGGSIS